MLRREEDSPNSKERRCPSPKARDDLRCAFCRSGGGENAVGVSY